MNHRSNINSILISNQNLLQNSMASINLDSKSSKNSTDKFNLKGSSSQKDYKPKIDNSTFDIQILQEIQGIQSNQDNCFKCKKKGQIYCCQNCFRSFHWKCIGSKKIQELMKTNHVTNFICQSCDFQNYCMKCNSNYPKSRPDLIGYSDHCSILSFYKCTHCYSKIHKSCLEIPLQALTDQDKARRQIRNEENFPHYICAKCLQNNGITQIITSLRLTNGIGIEKLYFYVLLNTNSPIHKGWFQEFTLKESMKKFVDNQTMIDDFIQTPSLYEHPEIDKIIEIRFPSKYKNASFFQVSRIIDGRSNNPIQQRYGNNDNFKFLIKWKQRDYTALTWEDETIIWKDFASLKKFLYEKQKSNCVNQNVLQFKAHKNSLNQHQQVHYKVLEYFLNEKSEIKQKYLHLTKQINPYNRLEYKSFEERMMNLDHDNAKQPFIQIIEVAFEKVNFNPVYEYMEKLILYFQKCYLTELILRPVLIVSDEVNEWQNVIKNQKKIKEHHLRYIKFFGSKKNTDAIKKQDFYSLRSPNLVKFDILILDYNYFTYEKKFIFQAISSYFIVLFDKSEKYTTQDDKMNFLRINYLPYKNKVQKQIFLVENSIMNDSTQQLVNNILNLSQSVKNPVKKAIFHTLDFSKKFKFNSQEPKLKLIIDKKYKQSLRIFQFSSKQILNQGQRLSYLKLIMSFGLNIKIIEQICIRLKQMNPLTWDFQQNNLSKFKQTINQYTSMFISIISKNSKQQKIRSNQVSINYFIFNYQSQTVLKRIIQLKRLKTQVENSYDDHSKFPMTKNFKFFYSGQCKTFPLWNIYEDYTLGALMVEEGYQRWNQIINSKKWALYHAQLQTRKIYQYDRKSSNFIIQQSIVAKKKLKKTQNSESIQNQTKQLLNDEQKKVQFDRTQEIGGIKQIPTTYGEYLINKIKNSKQFKQIQYEKLLDKKVLQGHIAERGNDILKLMM